MKQFLFTALLMLVILQSQAQNFAPVGAKWHYSIGNIDFNGVKCAVLTVQKDTLIHGITTSVIEVKLIDNPGVEKIISYEYLAKQNDSVMYYNPYDNRFHILYNFSAKAGDTIHVHKNLSKVTPGFLVPKFADDSIIFSYRILSTDSVMINESWRKRQIITNVPNSYYSMETFKTDSFRVIIDGLYSFTYLFGRAALMTMETHESMLRCYNDSTYNFKYAKWEKDCDFAQSNTGIAENDIRNQLTLYPNPIQTNGTLTISQSKYKSVSCKLINSLGETVLFSDVQDNRININNLPSGIYSLLLISNNEVIGRNRLVVYE
jgi:hypothetical protein